MRRWLFSSISFFRSPVSSVFSIWTQKGKRYVNLKQIKLDFVVVKKTNLVWNWGHRTHCDIIVTASQCVTYFLAVFQSRRLEICCCVRLSHNKTDSKRADGFLCRLVDRYYSRFILHRFVRPVVVSNFFFNNIPWRVGVLWHSCDSVLHESHLLILRLWHLYFLIISRKCDNVTSIA